MASEKITAIIDEIKGLSILELKELIDTYCEEFGVSAVAAAPAAAAAAAPAAEEKTEFDVVLAEVGANKMAGDHRSGPEGSEGPGRQRSEDAEGSCCEGRCRGNEEEAGRCRRQDRTEISLVFPSPRCRTQRGLF